MDLDDLTNRHPATCAVLKWFKYAHLPPALQEVSKPFADLALDLTVKLPDGPELTVGLRKLLEAKDCIVRAKVEQIAG